MRFRTIRVSLFAAAIGVTAFTAGAQDHPHGGQQPPQNAQSQPSQEELWATPTVSMLEPGDEPRHLLRLEAKQGDVRETLMSMDLALEQQLDGNPMPSPQIPTVKAVFRTTVKNVNQDKQTIRYAFEYDNVEVGESPDFPPGALEQMRQEMMILEEVNGTLTIDRRGVVQDGHYNIPAEATPMIRQQLQSFELALAQINSPLPKEKVGVNAKWKAELTMERNGIKVNQAATYTLKEVNGNMIRTALTVSQRASEQDFSPPGMPPGVTMHLNSLDGSGEGTIVRQRGALLPDQLDVSVKQTSEFSAEMGGQSRNVVQVLTSTVSLRPNESPKGDDAADASKEQTGN